MAKSLVAFFSWSGATRGLAQDIAKETGSDLFEVDPVPTYSRDYNVIMTESKDEVANKVHPEINDTNIDLDDYDVVFVGTPVWWGTMAPPIATFLSDHDWSGKIVMPFCTHGGGGKTFTEKDMRKLFKGADIRKMFVSRSRDHLAAEDHLDAWLADNHLDLAPKPSALSA